MNLNVNSGFVKVLELIDRSLVLQRMTWAVIAIPFVYVIRWW